LLKKFTIIALFFILSFFSVFSQPKITVFLTGGYLIPLSDLGGTFNEKYSNIIFSGFSDSNSYFMKKGGHYGIRVKFPINRKKLPLNVTGSISGNSFSQSKEYISNDTNIKVDISQSITSFGAGVEYSFTGKKTTINPFFGAELMLNLFSGSYSEDYIDSIRTLTLSNTIRVGLIFNAGVDIVLHNNIGFNVGLSYSLANLFGRSYIADTKRTYYLNDNNHTIDGVTYPTRIIAFLLINGGVSFYFGR